MKTKAQLERELQESNEALRKIKHHIWGYNWHSYKSDDVVLHIKELATRVSVLGEQLTNKVDRQELFAVTEQAEKRVSAANREVDRLWYLVRSLGGDKTLTEAENPFLHQGFDPLNMRDPLIKR